MKKILSMLLVVVICALPVLAVAEEQYHYISLSNFAFDIPGLLTGEVGATLTAGQGGDLLKFSASGGDSEIGTLTFKVDDEKMVATLNGMGSAYILDFAQAMELAGETAPSEFPDMDMEAFVGMMEGLIGLIADEPEFDEETTKQFETILGVDFENALTEEVTVFDAPYTLKKCSFIMNAAMIDEIYDTLAASDENFGKFWNNYKKFFSQMMEMDVEDFSFAKLFEAGGFDLQYPVTVWSSEDEKVVRVDVRADMALTSEGQDMNISIPYTVEVIEGDETLQMRVSMSMDDVEDGVNMEYIFQFLPVDQGTSFEMAMTADIEGEAMSFHLTGTLLETDEHVSTLDCSLTAGAPGLEETIGINGTYTQKAEGGFGIQGTLSASNMPAPLALHLDSSVVPVERDGYPGCEGRVALAVEMDDVKAEFSFDLATGSLPLEGMSDAIDTLPQINALELMENEELQAKALGELEAWALKAGGALLQTPGVAELLLTVTGGIIGSEYGVDYGYDSYESMDMMPEAS